jgi:hypothetical protein
MNHNVYRFRRGLLPVVAFTLLSTILFTGCAPSIYRAADFQTVAQTHKTIALLPFQVVMEAKKLPKNATLDIIKQQQQDNGYTIQSSAYSNLLKKQSRITVEVQDVDRTNALLKKAGIAYEDLPTLPKEVLAALLGVDAVISGKVTLSSPMSEGAAIGSLRLVGFAGNTHKVTIAPTIHERLASKLLWKFDYKSAGSLYSSPESLTDDLMEWVSRKFPYKS